MSDKRNIGRIFVQPHRDDAGNTILGGSVEIATNRAPLVLEVADDRCPLCGEEHDQSVTFNGVVMVACPEMPQGWVLPLNRVDKPGPFTLSPPPRTQEEE